MPTLSLFNRIHALVRPLVFLSAFGLAACANTEFPYKMGVQQGNYIAQEAVAQLKPGMTTTQVRNLMGTPLLMDAFHANRWDYIYRYTPGKGKPTERRVTLYFQDDALLRIHGDVIASNGAPDETPSTAARMVEIQAPKKK